MPAAKSAGPSATPIAIAQRSAAMRAAAVSAVRK